MTEEIDVRSLLKLVFKKKKLIIGGTLFFAVLGGALSFLVPRAYQSSLILEVGMIDLSAGEGRQEMEFIEEPEVTANVISSTGVLEEVNRELELGLKPIIIKNSLEVITFIQAGKFLPILEIVYRGRTPREAVDILNALAGIVIKRHDEKYRPYRVGLEKRIRFNRDKITAIEKIIAAQHHSRDLSQKYIDRGEVSAEEFSRELNELETTGSTPVDMLYLQGAALREKLNIATLTRFKSEMDLKIGSGEKEIADAEMEIADLQSRLGLSAMTRIVSPAIPIENPVQPNRILFVLIPAIIGCALMTLIVTGREYLN